jgi:transposase
MARQSGRPRLVLEEAERERLMQLAGSRTAPKREVERANILLRFAQGEAISDIQKKVGVSRPSIYKCIDKALAAGVEAGLKDKFHRPREPTITPEAGGWVVSLVCTKPKDHGLAAELWTLSALAAYVREHAIAAGHSSLSRAGKSTIWRIVNAHEIKPHRIRYYLERRDEQFEAKMHEVLMVYREIAMDLEATAPPSERPVYTISVDEKPGVQALATTAPDLPPYLGAMQESAEIMKYVRHGLHSCGCGPSRRTHYWASA